MCDRFKLEVRSGIIAIYDTQHPEYEERAGCQADAPFVIAAWIGHKISKKGGIVWRMENRQIKKAKTLHRLLNESKN